MLDKFINNKKSIGLEINLDNFSIQGYELFVKNGEVKINRSFSYGSLADFRESILTEFPYYINISGKGVINRKIKSSSMETSSSLLHKVLPNADIQDFYLQKYEISDTEAYISIVRKTVIEPIFEIFKSKSFLCGVFLAPFVIDNLIESITSEGQVEYGPYKVTVEDSRIIDIQSSERSNQKFYDVSGENIRQDLLLAYCTAASHFLPSSRITNFSAEIEIQKKEFNQSRLFKSASWAALILFLSVLLINYLCFQAEFDKQKKLESIYDANQSVITRFEKTKEELSQKKKLFEITGLNNKSHLSFFVDRLLFDLPNGIQLERLNFNPLKKSNDNDSLLLFENNKILLTGSCQQSTVLNDWVNSLSGKKFIAKAILVDYNRAKEQSSARFNLEILLNQ